MERYSEIEATSITTFYPVTNSGDILYIEKCPPYPEQEAEELGGTGRLKPLLQEPSPPMRVLRFRAGGLGSYRCDFQSPAR